MDSTVSSRTGAHHPFSHKKTLWPKNKTRSFKIWIRSPIQLHL